MIPVLYEKTGTKTKLAAIGAMVDVLSCQVTRERNGIYEATMIYPKDGQLAEELKTERLLYIKPGDDEEPQPMEIMTVTSLNDNTIQVYTQHISYRLSGMVAMPFSATTATEAAAKLQQYMGEFTLTTDIVSDTPYSLAIPTPCRSVLGGMDGSLLDVYGGEFIFDGWDVHWRQSAGSNRGVLIAYGKNLTDLSAVEDNTGVVTGVLPYYQLQNEDGTTSLIVPDDPVMVADRTLSYDRIISLDCSGEFETTPSVEQLQQFGANWLKNQYTKTADSVTLSYLDLYSQGESDAIKNMEYVRLCDTVTVWDKRYNLQLTAKVVQIIYDTIAERNDSVQVGEATSNFADTILSTNQTVDKIQQTYPSRWQQSMYELAKKITGQTDSHVIFLPMEYPSAIVVAKNTDLTAAGNSGLYVSSGGIAGTDDLAAALQDMSLFKLAITIDGNIMGDRIVGLTIQGEQIIGGIIRSKDGEFYLNLQSGDAYVPRLLGRTTDGGTWVGAEQGQLNISGAQYNGIRYYTQSSADGDQTDYLYLLKSGVGVYLIPASSYEGPCCVLELAAPGSNQSSPRIFSVRRKSDMNQMMYVTSDGNLAIAGQFVVLGQDGQIVDTTDGLSFVKSGQFVFRDSDGRAYLTINPGNVAGLYTDYNIETAQNVIANAVQADIVRLKGDGRAAFQQFTDKSFGLTFPSTTLLRIAVMESENSASVIMQFDPAGAILTNRDINLNGHSILNSSDERIKKYIADSQEEALPILEKIKMRKYTYRTNAGEALANKKVRFGEIAQELKEVYPEAVIYDEQNDRYYIDKISLIDLLLKGLQEAWAEIKELKQWKEQQNGSN